MYYIRHTLYNKFKIIEIKSYFFSKYREYPDRFLSFLRNLFPFISPRETSSRSIKQKYGEMAFINRWVLTAWAKPWVPFRLSREHDGSSGSQVPSHRRFNVGVIVVHGATAAIKDHGNKLIKMSLPIHPTRIAWRFSHARPSHLPRPTRPPLRNVDSPRPLPHLQSTWPHLFLEIRLQKTRSFRLGRIWRIGVSSVLITGLVFSMIGVSSIINDVRKENGEMFGWQAVFEYLM